MKTAALLSVVLVVWLSHAGLRDAALAQQAGVFEVLIPASSLDQPTSDPGVTLGQVYLRITAYADGDQCTSVDTTQAGTDMLLRLGETGQPDACSLEGTTVTFVTGQCQQLASEFKLAPGTRETLSNMAPMPPASPPIEGCVPPTVNPRPDATPPPQPPPGGISPPRTGSAGLAADRYTGSTSPSGGGGTSKALTTPASMP